MVGETAGLTRESVGEVHKILECTQAHPPRNKHQKGTVCLWIVEEVTESGARANQVALFPLWHLPSIQHHNAGKWLPQPREYLRINPLLHNRCAKTKKYSPNKRIDQNPRKRINQRGDRQPIWCRVQNAGNQDAHRHDWVQPQNKGRSEGYTKWNKGKYIGNQQWREGNQDSNKLFGTEGRYKHSTRTEWTRIQKKKKKKKIGERLRNLWDNFKHSNIQIIGMPVGEAGRARNWTLVWKNNDRKLPQCGEKSRYISSGSLESPKEVGHKEEHTKAHHH